MAKYDDTESNFAVEELEKKVLANANDFNLKENLVDALIDRYLEGDDEHSPGEESDIKRVKEILAKFPAIKSYYARAYVSYLEKKDKDAVDWLLKYSKGSNPNKAAEPFTADDLYLWIIQPFHSVSKEFWCELARAFTALWPGSPAALVVRGYASEADNKSEEAFDLYDRALQTERDYWLAAWKIAENHYDRKNWQVASQYYDRTLEAEIAQEIPQILFEAAWCSGKSGEHAKEEKRYRACLDLDPDLPCSRNNLGWSLYKQSRFEEALAIFDDCIQRKVDRSFPYINRARTLAKLGRLAEAIDAWKQTGRSGKPSKFRQEQIAKLEAKIRNGENNDGGNAFEDEDDDEEAIFSSRK